MASFDDLGQALRDDAAANAPRASAIDVDAVTRAARARRRPRQWAVGTLSVVAVLGVGGLAVAAVAPPVLIAASESADLEAGMAEGGAAPLADGADERTTGPDLADIVACGAAPLPLEIDDSALALELRIATTVAADAGPIDAIAVLVNRGDDAMTLLTAATAVAVLTQNGAVVGVELPRDGAALELDLAPGESYELPMVISTLACRGSASESLAPGAYGVVAVLEMVSGPTALVVAEPVEIRLD
ncbi:hypothetical protein [Microcella sp.]|uniref:hypothetical protein n=1 Tax=Microcella sp. TaxID=1913979 RepID=UPI0025627942|nr:hypothetical protein [Microcella sp.]MBX9471195.1 hypothetical protein [Microcella sp.]